MPRPRILCSARAKPQKTDENVNKQPQVVTIDESEEPDCEIIKIEDGNDDKKKISLQVRGVAQVQYRGAQCLPSMLSLQFLPARTANSAGNASGQNVVMVLPVSSSHSQIFNPTLCTLEKIENPNEISEIRQVVGSRENPGTSAKNICRSRPNEKQLKNTRKSVLQSVFTHISAEKQRQIEEQRVFDPAMETAKKGDASVDTETEDSSLQQPSTSSLSSVVEINSDISTITIDTSGKIENSSLRPEESEAAYARFSDTSGSLGTQERPNFTPKITDPKINNFRTPSRKISLSKISIHKNNLIKNGSRASLLRKKVASDANSSFEEKAASAVPKRSENIKKLANFVRNGTPDGPNSPAKPERETSMQKAARDENSVAKSKKSTLQFEKLTDDEYDFDSPESFSPANDSIVEIEKEENSSVASEPTASDINNCEAGLLWNLNCIVCERNFTNRTKLHRHATLAHPDIQILFCEFCNNSFLTHEKLEAHRVKNCRAEITEILETIVIEDENDEPLPPEEISRNIGKEETISESNESPETGNTKESTSPEQLKTRRCSAGVLIRRKRGRPRKNLGNCVVTHKYVEEEVINHAIGEKRRELVTAEIKKLVVPIARLEDTTLKKYLRKRTESPLADDKVEEGSTRKDFGKKKRGRPRKNYDNVGNLRRAPKTPRKIMELKKLKTNLKCAQEMRSDTFFRHTDKIITRNTLRQTYREKSGNTKDRGKIVDASPKKRPIYTDIDDSSNGSGSNYIPVVEKDDSGSSRQSIIRKLPSRSSAASFESLKTDVQNRQRQRVKRSPEKTYGEWILRRQKFVECTNCVKKPVKKHTESESCRTPSERSIIKTNNDTKLDVDGAAQFKKIEENRQQNEEKTDGSKESVTRQTYLPSKRKAMNASKFKRRCDPTSADICLMCKELLELTKQLAGHFEGNKANKISVKCPLCSLYFISLFYLKKHVSRFHLHCQNQFPSQLSESLMLTKSVNDELLDCETEIELALDCQHCTDKFSNETDLVNHVFAQHDPPIFYEDTKTDLPYYVDDLPNSYFQTSSRLNSIESSTNSRPSKTINQLMVKRKSVTSQSRSVEHEAANNSSESGDRLEKNLTAEPMKSSKSTDISTKSSDDSGKVEMTFLRTEPEKHCTEETPSTSKPTKGDGATSDRDYLLKQLLSDDSSDSCDYPEPATSRPTQELPKLSRKIAVESESVVLRPQCHICDKEFKRTQDLLVHSLEHDFPDVNSEESSSNAIPDAITYLFVDPEEYDWFSEELAAPAALKSQAEESGTTAPIPERIADDLDTSDVLFCSGDEDNDFSLVYKTGDELETETTFEKKKTASPASISWPKNGELEKVCLQESRVGKRVSKFISEDTEPQTKKLKVLEEFLETEKGLANPDDADSIGKLPIECSKCNRKFPNQASLNEHLFFLHDDSLKATVLTDVVSPMSGSDDQNSKEPRQWRCEECHHNFKLLQSYGRHRYFVHGDDEMVHVCENCCKVMTTVTMVNVHICIDVASYNCRTCNETFSTGMSLRLHNMYKHKETEGPHMCLPCNKKFLTNAMLKRHEQWEHRFMRPYRPRKSSPVHMATPDDVSTKTEDHFVENEMDSGCDQEYVDMEYEFTGKEAAKGRKSVSRSPEVFQKKRRSQEEITRKQESRNLRKDPSEENSLVTYIDEEEIIQCNLCRLYCLSMGALRTHMANSHSIMGEVCRICEKMYSKGKLIRHMIDQHINPCETYTEDKESIWNVGKTVEEKDAEELIRMLGMNRFISLCEYQRFSESTLSGAVRCPNCMEEFASCGDYKFHFLMKHDTMCALCNIEFKSGDKAAVHKTEDHGSVDSYIWFADQTVGALTAVTNFSEAAEKSFIEMISRDSDESHDEYEDEDCGEDSETTREYFADEEYERVSESDERQSSSEALEEENDQKLMIVVTDEDLRYYGIGTRNPNIWGLASKISSTSTELTPKDVKDMLESYFGM